MKFGVAILVIVVIAGCSSAAPPVSPSSPAPPTQTIDSALLWVMVLGEGGSCIEGATIQVIRADGGDPPIPQETPCGAWDYGGGVTLMELTRGAEIRLRGAASNYASRELTFFRFRCRELSTPCSSLCRRHNSRQSKRNQPRSLMISSMVDRLAYPDKAALEANRSADTRGDIVVDVE